MLQYILILVTLSIVSDLMSIKYHVQMKGLF